MTKWLVILFAVSVLFNAPTPCAHALAAGLDTQADDQIHQMDMTDHGAHAHHGERQEQPDDTDCHGGAGCDGCLMMMAYLPPESPIVQKPVFTQAATLLAENVSSRLSLLDPPPPRV